MDRETTALLERAAALRRSGKVDEAIAAYSELLHREPDLPDSWYNLGWLQRQARQYEEALESYGEALQRGVGDPQEVQLNRAVILSDHLGRHDEAQAALEAALALKPDYLPALLNLGNLHEDRGNREAAEAAYRRALEIAPGDALALSRLAGVVETQSDEAAALIEQLRAELSASRPASERADLGFALARLLDARADYAGAFEACEAANAASKQSMGGRGYDRRQHEKLVDRLIDEFQKSAPPPRGDGAPAVFIVGMFRSGSTLMERILASHSAVVAAGELDLIPSLAATIPGYPDGITAADDATFAKWCEFYTRGIAPFSRDGAIVTDKRPDNFLHVGLIKTLFPGAKIIHTRREQLDNLLSLYFLHLDGSMAYALDLNDAAHWYREYERLMAHWKRLYPDDIFEVDYDALVQEPRPLLQELVGWLGLDWEESLLDFHKTAGAVKTASVWQVREPLHARSSGRWRNYEVELTSALGGLADQ